MQSGEWEHNGVIVGQTSVEADGTGPRPGCAASWGRRLRRRAVPVSRRSIAGVVIVAVAMVFAISGPGVASAHPHSVAAGLLVTGPGVELVKKHFDPHAGNETCGEPGPDRVPFNSQKSFCYKADCFAGPGCYDTEVSFDYEIDLRGSGAEGDSGYHVKGFVKVPGTPGNATLTCDIVRLNRSLPAQHLKCATSTVHPLDDYSPEPHWTVTWAPRPAGAPTVYFLGDSVTAGFGYCGTEGGPNSDSITCKPNESMANNWIFGDNSLNNCTHELKDGGRILPPNDRCSNNNFSGQPWDAGHWVKQPGAPTVAYAYVIAAKQKESNPALVEDWAVTSSTPANWDPVTNGAFGDRLKTIKNSYVVMTLGANPLLNTYLHIALLKEDGVCAGSTIVRTGGRIPNFAAPLDASAKGVFRCFDQQWDKEKQGEHLLHVYKTLLDNGNHVLVVGYPAVCPWSFGDWQTVPNPSGPAAGDPCTSHSLPVFDGSAKGGPRVSQWDQARALGAHGNDLIQGVVGRAAADGHKNEIAFVLPNQTAWAEHQAWSGSSWIFKNDTWVHPSIEGHKQLAATVLSGMCTNFKHWCGDPPAWNSARLVGPRPLVQFPRTGSRIPAGPVVIRVWSGKGARAFRVWLNGRAIGRRFSSPSRSGVRSLVVSLRDGLRYGPNRLFAQVRPARGRLRTDAVRFFVRRGAPLPGRGATDWF